MVENDKESHIYPVTSGIRHELERVYVDLGTTRNKADELERRVASLEQREAVLMEKINNLTPYVKLFWAVITAGVLATLGFIATLATKAGGLFK